MSFILDALRKSEHARQHLGGATLAELPLGRRQRSQPWWVIALAVLLVVNVIALSLVLLRKPADVAVVAQSTPAAVNQPRTIAPSVALQTQTPLADEAAPPATVQYETIPRQESPLDVEPANGPTLVKPIESPAAAQANLSAASVGSGIRDLHVDMHVYAKDPKDRFVFINNHKYTEGQLLPQGPRIAEITSDGVILLYQGQTLHLPRT